MADERDYQSTKQESVCVCARLCVSSRSLLQLKHIGAGKTAIVTVMGRKESWQETDAAAVENIFYGFFFLSLLYPARLLYRSTIPD